MKEPDRVNAEYILVRELFTDDELNDLGWKHPFPHPFCHPELVEGSPSVIASPLCGEAISQPFATR